MHPAKMTTRQIMAWRAVGRAIVVVVTVAFWAIVAWALCGCRCQRPAPRYNLDVPPPIETHTTREIHTTWIDTLLVSLPEQRAERHTPDSTSHLETDAAISDAAILPDGSLFHSLEQKPTPIPVAVPLSADTIEVEIERPMPYPVPAELTRSERLYLRVGRWAIWMLAGAAMAGALTLIHRARRRH